ncbi:AzlC family ABC transporter permease [Pseudonocardia acaciae]|uniref:AzlC family ABC transporter permease n=1 Tax=Pseudonocardia acaciae TaxID=551276 RepID=UPI0006863F89|nr:AzlC family ABC transporter permease [Pseudonocardia acaciae]
MTAEPTTDPDDTRARFRAGLRIGLPLAVPSFVLAVSFGALATGSGWSAVAVIVSSLLVFSGSAQFALVGGLAGGGGVLVAVTAAALINMRFLPMGLAIGPSLKGGRVRRALEGQAVVDASWAAAHLGGGRFDRERLFGTTAVQWAAWMIGTVVGAVVAPPHGLMQDLGLDAMFPAFFLILLIDELRGSRRAKAIAGVSALLAAGLVFVLPMGLALLLASLPALVGLRAARAAGA